MLQVRSTLTQSSTPRKPSFLLRSSSIASLVAWKDRFECYSGRFLKQPSFISYTIHDDMPCKLADEISTIENNYGPDNDILPKYPTVVNESTLPFPEEGNKKNVSFTQDFTALENYLKKKLSIKKKPGSNFADAELETSKVFQWIRELPEGDNLGEFLEASGIPTKHVDMIDLKQKLREFLEERLAGVDHINTNSIEHEKSKETKTAVPKWKRQMSNLEELAHDDNLEKWLESIDVPYFRPIPETKKEIRKYLHLPADEANPTAVSVPTTEHITIPKPSNKEMEELVPKWKELVEKMGTLKNETELDNWLENLEVPHNVPKAKVHAEIKKFFRHESFENFAGKSIIFQDHHVAKMLWEKFEDSSLLKQIGMVAGTTAVLGLIAVFSTTMLSLAIPAAFAINPFFVEVFAQYFLQRQDVAFSLLNFHAAQAKPLSTAWAKQYVLWKYC